ncbi:MAG: TOMM precursor leader peptide-binding protein [Kineosporiaceae bacterium]
MAPLREDHRTRTASAPGNDAEGTRTLCLKQHVRAHVVAGEAAYLVSEDAVTAVHGAAAARVVPLLDGTRDLPAVLREAGEGVTAAQVGRVVLDLVEGGLLAVREQLPTAPEQRRSVAWFDAAGLDGLDALHRMRSCVVTVSAVGGAATGAVVHALRAAGVEVEDRGDDLVVDLRAASAPVSAPPSLTVVVTDDYLHPHLSAVDDAQRATGRPWVLAKPDGGQMWIGPFFSGLPGDGACWHCLSARLSAHRQAEGHLRRRLGGQGPLGRPASGPSLLSPGASLLASEVAAWLAGVRREQQSVWVMDLIGLQGRHHELRARPECPACGDPTRYTAAAVRPVVLQPRPYAAGEASGGHRALGPAAVLTRYGHLVSPITGVVKEIRRDERTSGVLHAYRSGGNVAAAARSLDQLRAGLRAENGGKGVTALDAEVGALCEAVERHSGTARGDEPRVRARMSDLGADAVHPDSCRLLDPRQIAARSGWNAEHGDFSQVGAAFDPQRLRDWTPVWSLSAGRHRWLPTSMLYFGAGEDGEELVADSNGCAAGSSLEDAVLQGLLELVERDAVALWWYNRTAQPGVDLDSFADRWLGRVHAEYAAMHRDLWVLDLTSDLGVPVMAAISRRTDKPAQDVMFGFGAHLDPAVALRRAVTELNQMMPPLVGVPVGDVTGAGYGCDDPEALAWWRTATVESCGWLAPSAAPARTRASYAHEPTADLLEEVTRVRTAVEAAGLEVLVLDQTRPELGLPVVRVIVPGLRPFWARFAPGRLFDVPVALGRLAEATPYEQLNPVAMFL